MAEIGRRAPAPVVANMIEKGKTPVSAERETRRARFPPDSLSARRPVRRRTRPGVDLRKDSRATTQRSAPKTGLMAFDEFNDLIGVEAKYKLAERYGVK